MFSSWKWNRFSSRDFRVPWEETVCHTIYLWMSTWRHILKIRWVQSLRNLCCYLHVLRSSLFLLHRMRPTHPHTRPVPLLVPLNHKQINGCAPDARGRCETQAFRTSPHNSPGEACATMRMCGNPAALTIKRINPVAFGLISWEQIHQPFEENSRSSELLFPFQSWCCREVANLHGRTSKAAMGVARNFSLAWPQGEIMAHVGVEMSRYLKWLHGCFYYP